MAKPTSTGRAVVDKVITEAVKTGNIQAAIRKHGKTLSLADVKVLQSLSASDLKQISNLRNKLGPLGRAADDNNGASFRRPFFQKDRHGTLL